MKLGSGLNLISIKINNMLIVRRRNNNNFSSDGSGIIVLTRVMMIWFGWNLGWNWLETNREGTILDRTRNHNFGKIKKQWMVGLVISILLNLRLIWKELQETCEGTSEQPEEQPLSITFIEERSIESNDLGKN